MLVHEKRALKKSCKNLDVLNQIKLLYMCMSFLAQQNGERGGEKRKVNETYYERLRMAKQIQ